MTGPVRRMLQSDTLEVLGWQVRPLGGGFGNPVSLGLYGITGSGQDRGEVVTWSVVLKVAQSPANVGEVNMGEGDDPTHWNYWKREMRVYQSGLLDRLPLGLAAPRCFGVKERPDNTIWLWLEDVADRYAGAWPLERYGLAARHFGRFNGAYMAGRPRPAYPWLSIGLLRQWCANLLDFAGMDGESHQRPSLWEHPLVRRLYPAPDSNPVLHFLADRERFLAALDRVPQTLCHQDAYPTNLMARRGEEGNEETVAVDWAMAGMGPVGEELAQIALGALDHTEGTEPAEIDQVVFGGYLDGLRDSGWRGDTRIVRFGYVASAVLRVGLVLLWSLAEALAQSQPATPDEAPATASQEPLEAAIEEHVRATRLVLELAEEAFELFDAAP